MKSFTPHRLWSLVLGLPLACGAAEGGGAFDTTADGTAADGFLNGDETTLKAGSTPLTFPGGGTSGAAQPLTAGLAPETSTSCDPEPSASVPASPVDVQSVCFYGEDDPNVPAAVIEQVVEVVGNSEWVHIRLTLNPAFVDNTYGETAVGWGDVGDAPGAAPPPAGEAPVPPAGAPEPPAAGEAPEPPADAPAPGAETPEPPTADGTTPPRGPGRAPGGEPRPGRGGGGHSFKDLVGSDHAEIQLLDAGGEVVLHFRLDYLSESELAATGYASLGVSGGDGRLIAGEEAWILASATSMDRNLNACGLGDFLESSPATDADYTPDASASDWDYRVAYEVWVATEAFGSSGFGSALIESVHASPSKLAGNTLTVLPAPCPPDPSAPEAAPAPIPQVLSNIR